MDFKEYQTEAHKTAKYHQYPYMRVAYDDGFDVVEQKIRVSYAQVPIYPFVKVMSEAAELAEPAIKIGLRGDDNVLDEGKIEKEIGDILWYCAEMATILGVSLESIARNNIEKLKDRQNRNVINGSGDNR